MGEARTCADIVPVRVVGSELLVCAGLDDVYPCGDLELARTLKVGSVRGNECVRAELWSSKVKGHKSVIRHSFPLE